MTTNTHGGPRPKTSDDDRRGKHHSPKPGSGRKPNRFAVKVGDDFFVTTVTAEGLSVFPSAVWQVAEITRSHVIFVADNGDRVKLLR